MEEAVARPIRARDSLNLKGSSTPRSPSTGHIPLPEPTPHDRDDLLWDSYGNRLEKKGTHFRPRDAQRGSGADADVWHVHHWEEGDDWQPFAGAAHSGPNGKFFHDVDESNHVRTEKRRVESGHNLSFVEFRTPP